MRPNTTFALNVQRLPQHLEKYYEIKDPSIVQVSHDQFMIFASVGNSIEQRWKVGRFASSSPEGIWQEIEPVDFHDLEGPQLCAPAVTYEIKNDQPVWTMYIQTACFEENGVIALATSTDGHNFYGTAQALVSRDTVEQTRFPIIGVYDVAVSEVIHNQEVLECMLYSGYRRIGCGDIYMSTKRKEETVWSIGKCVLSQEDVPFHNHPDSEHFEWGLEGAKLIQMSQDCFLMIGVCFVPKPNEFLGMRQRVFFAVADNPMGSFKPVDTPFMPHNTDERLGENGHPDTLIIDDKLVVLYQQRGGNGYPWYMRLATYDLFTLEQQLKGALNPAESREMPNLDSVPTIDPSLIINSVPAENLAWSPAQ